MKFIHIADVHLDKPFKILGYLGEKRRLEQIKTLYKLIEYIEKENVGYLFISGDLYEHEYIKNSTMEVFIEMMNKIPNTKVFIAPRKS